MGEEKRQALGACWPNHHLFSRKLPFNPAKETNMEEKKKKKKRRRRRKRPKYLVKMQTKKWGRAFKAEERTASTIFSALHLEACRP